MPVGPWPSAATQPKAKKDAALKGFRPEESGAALNAWGIAMPWIPRHARALRQTPLDENDAYSDLLDTLLMEQEAQVGLGKVCKAVSGYG